MPYQNQRVLASPPLLLMLVGWLVGWLVGSLHIPLRILERDFGASDIIELTKEDAIHSSLLDGGAVDW
jgi:hypothetical protein